MAPAAKSSRLLSRRVGLLSGAVCVIIFLVTPAFSQTPGVLAAYGFNEGSGTTVGDLSGNNLNGTTSGTSWTTTGRYGNALSFNGSSYVNLGNPTALQLTGSMTLEAWIFATANPSDDGNIISKANGSGWQLKTSPDTGPQTFGIQVTGTSSSAQRYSNTVRSLNTWYHVAGVYNASAGTLDIYVNGTLDNGTLSGKVPASQANQNINVNIGRRSDGFNFIGTIDEVRVYNRALTPSEIQSDMQTPIGGTPPPPDTIPPTVAMTAPANNASVSGSVTLSANASDNVGVVGVQFLVDGQNLGSEVTTAPYNLLWNLGSVATGTHTVSARARDFANNQATDSITVNVTGPSPDQIGQWTAVMNWPIVAVHAALLPTGKVLAWSDYTAGGGAQLWNPGTNTFADVSLGSLNLFCAGLTFLADGRLLVVGGIENSTDDFGPTTAEIFDPSTSTWSAAAAMVTGRYYPTATTLPDGRIMVQGGTTTCVTCIADTPEIFDPVHNTWTALTTAKKSFKYYPHAHVLPDGRVLVSSQDDKAIASSVLDYNSKTWTNVGTGVWDGHSSVQYLPGKILKAGTATADNPGLPTAATTYIIDMNSATPAWQQTAPMAYPRAYLNLTVLPDGQVLATGGSTLTDLANFSAAVYAAELWSPSTATWSTMASEQKPRLYHSTAVLLPDARVLVAGGGRQGIQHTYPPNTDPKDQANAEIFSPPYLFKGARPVITSAPSVIQYSSTFPVTTPDAARITAVSLIGLSAVTHAFNENQRFVPLSFSQVGGGLNVQAPLDGNTAVPGPYMLFLVDSNGVPSIAAMVRLPAPSEDTQAPTAPGNLSATGSAGAASLTWSASNDNVAVTSYNVHRSTVSGFAPSPANRVGQASTTSFNDAGLQSGTYYYLVTAQDAAGNVSAPSNEASAIVMPRASAPTFSPGAGTYNSVQSVTISDTTPGATIYYTTDSSTPPGSPTTQQTAPGVSAVVPVSNTATTLKAMASASGYGDSSVASSVYTLVAATPSFVSPAPGTYGSPQSVTLGDSTSGSTIYYTTDGSTPTTSSTSYTSPITVSVTTTIKAMAAASGFQNSAVVSGTYTIQVPTTATPTMTPAGGTYNSAQQVSLSDATSGATIYYTTDSTTPTIPPSGSSTVWVGTPIAVTTSGTTIKAIASSPGNQNSAVASATYTLQAAAPSFSPAPGSYPSAQTVTLSDTTPNTTIYYTTNGTTPTTASPVYTAPINVSATTTIKAMAAASGFQSSSVATGTYTIGAAPAISFVQVASATPQSVIASVSVKFSKSQTAGNLNIVVVGWNDATSQVASVTDTTGNAYVLVIGPTRGNGISQSIYYAGNVRAGTNTVNVTFSQAAANPDIRILEYKGVSTADVAAGGAGSGATSSTGAATTTAARELIFAANTVAASTKSAGSGFTSRVITNPDGDIAEDKIVTTTGSYSATAPLTGNNPWVMQMATFKP